MRSDGPGDQKEWEVSRAERSDEVRRERSAGPEDQTGGGRSDGTGGQTGREVRRGGRSDGGGWSQVKEGGGTWGRWCDRAWRAGS